MDGEVRAHFACYYMAERGAWDELEQVYLFNRLEMDEGIAKNFREQLNGFRHNAHNAKEESLQQPINPKVHKRAAVISPDIQIGQEEEEFTSADGLEKIYNVLIVLCVLLALNILVLGLYMKKIDVFGFLKSKIFGKSSTEYEELLK